MKRRRGFVLFLVLFFVLLLAASIAAFLRRVAFDAGVAVNRDRALQAEALARGGVRLAQALLLEDLRLAAQGKPPDSLHDIWARVRDVNLVDDPDVSLVVEIEDAAAVINLNGFAPPPAPATGAGAAPPDPANPLGGGKQGQDADAESRRLFLQEFLSRVIDDMPGRPEEKLYDPAELAENLIDWVDADDVRLSGGPEQELYAKRDPPDRPDDRPLLSVDELRRVEGFDHRLVEALRPYVGVYPLVGGGGVNLNTAPPWVLYQLTRGTDVSGMRQVEEDDVRRILDAREKNLICSAEAEGVGCVSINELFEGESVAPKPIDRSRVFAVRAVARVVDVERSIEAVLDLGTPSDPLRLSWRVQ